MRKRHLWVGLVMLVASAGSYGLVQMTAASPASADIVETASASVAVPGAAAPVVAPTAEPTESFLDATPESVTLLVTGVALLGAAAGVRRHAS